MTDEPYIDVRDWSGQVVAVGSESDDEWIRANAGIDVTEVR